MTNSVSPTTKGSRMQLDLPEILWLAPPMSTNLTSIWIKYQAGAQGLMSSRSNQMTAFPVSSLRPLIVRAMVILTWWIMNFLTFKLSNAATMRTILRLQTQKNLQSQATSSSLPWTCPTADHWQFASQMRHSKRSQHHSNSHLHHKKRSCHHQCAKTRRSWPARPPSTRPLQGSNYIHIQWIRFLSTILIS